MVRYLWENRKSRLILNFFRRGACGAHNEPVMHCHSPLDGESLCTSLRKRMTHRVSNMCPQVASCLIPLHVIAQAHDSSGLKYVSTSGLLLDTLARHCASTWHFGSVMSILVCPRLSPCTSLRKHMTHRVSNMSPQVASCLIPLYVILRAKPEESSQTS